MKLTNPSTFSSRDITNYGTRNRGNNGSISGNNGEIVVIDNGSGKGFPGLTYNKLTSTVQTETVIANNKILTDIIQSNDINPSLALTQLGAGKTIEFDVETNKIIEIFDDKIDINYYANLVGGITDETFLASPILISDPLNPALLTTNQTLIGSINEIFNLDTSDVYINLTFADSPYTIVPSTGTYFKIDSSGGNIIMNLPSCVAQTTEINIIIKKINESNYITILPNGLDTIDNQTSKILNGKSSILLSCDMISAWTIIQSYYDFISDGYTYYVNQHYNGIEEYGSYEKPFKTIQACLTQIGNPINITDERKMINIIVETGMYDEDISIPAARNIKLIAHGLIVLGDGSARYFDTSTTPRNITYIIDDSKEFASNPRPTLTLMSYEGMAISTHMTYGKYAWIISGNLLINNLSVATTCEMNVSNTRIVGNVGPVSAPTGILNSTWINSRISGTISGLPTLNMNIIDNCLFDSAISGINSIGRIIKSSFSSTIGCGFFNNYVPLAPSIEHTYINGIITTTGATSIVNIDSLSEALNPISVAGTLSKKNVIVESEIYKNSITYITNVAIQALGNEGFIFADTSGGNVMVRLPILSGTTNAISILIKKISSLNELWVYTQAGETIDGVDYNAGPLIISDLDFIEVMSDKVSNWSIVRAPFEGFIKASEVSYVNTNMRDSPNNVQTKIDDIVRIYDYKQNQNVSYPSESEKILYRKENMNLSSYPIDYISTGINPQLIVINHNYLYFLMNGATSTFLIFDISEYLDFNITNPQAYEINQIVLGFSPMDIIVYDDITYIICSTGELLIYDCSDPENLNLLSTTVFYAVVGNSLAISPENKILCIAYNNAIGSQFVDISDLTNPIELNIFGGQTTSVAIKGTYAYFINESISTLSVYDFSNPLAIVLSDSFVIGTLPYSIIISGKYAYIAEETLTTIYIVDIETIGTFSVVSSFAGAGQAIYGGIILSENSNMLYSIARNNCDIKAFDITIKSSPIIIETFASLPSTSIGVKATILNQYLFIPAVGPNRVEIVQIKEWITNWNLVPKDYTKWGSIDSFSRRQLWFYADNTNKSIIRLGAGSGDGDPNDISSEGIVVYGPDLTDVQNTGHLGYARIKHNIFGLFNYTTPDPTYYFFRADNNGVYLKSTSAITSFNVDRTTGQIDTIGEIITTDDTETTGVGTGSVQTGGGIYAAKTIWTDIGFHVGPTSMNIDQNEISHTSLTTNMSITSDKGIDINLQSGIEFNINDDGTNSLLSINNDSGQVLIPNLSITNLEIQRIAQATVPTSLQVPEGTLKMWFNTDNNLNKLVYNDETIGDVVELNDFKFENIFVVAKTGAKYSVIQDAIDDAIDGTPSLIIVYPGIYTENIILKNNMCICGTDNLSVHITSLTGSTITLPLASGGSTRLTRLKISTTPLGGTTDSHAITVLGTATYYHLIDNCIILGVPISTYINSIINIPLTSLMFFNNCIFQLRQSNSTQGGTINFIHLESTGLSSQLIIKNSSVDCIFKGTTAGDNLVFLEDRRTIYGKIDILSIYCQIATYTSGTATNFTFLDSTSQNVLANGQGSTLTDSYFRIQDYLLTNSGTMTIVKLNSGGNSGRIMSTSTRYEFYGFTNQWICDVAATDTFTSSFDSVYRNLGTEYMEECSTGLGSYEFLGSPNDGELQLSKGIVLLSQTITSDYGWPTDDWHLDILICDTTLNDITVTFPPDVSGYTQGANVRIFNIGTNLVIIDPNGIEIDNDTSIRVVGGSGHVQIMKIGTELKSLEGLNYTKYVLPSDVPNLEYWMDGADISTYTIVNDGLNDYVQQWDDKSGNVRNASNPAVAPGTLPAYVANYQNGLPVMRYDRTRNSFLNWGTVGGYFDNSAGRGMTIIVLCRPTIGLSGALLSKFSTTSSTREYAIMPNLAYLYNNTTLTSRALTMNTNEWQFLEMNWTPGQQFKCYINKSYVGPGSSAITTILNRATVNHRIGYSDSGATLLAFDGYVAEIVMYSRSLTRTESDNLIGTMAAKWYITSIGTNGSTAAFYRDDISNTIFANVPDTNLNMGNGTVATPQINNTGTLQLRMNSDNSGTGEQIQFQNYTTTFGYIDQSYDFFLNRAFRPTQGVWMTPTVVSSTPYTPNTAPVLNINTASIDITLNLPNPSTYPGKEYFIKKISNLNKVYINDYTTGLIDVTQQIILVGMESVVLRSNSAKWFIQSQVSDQELNNGFENRTGSTITFSIGSGTDLRLSLTFTATTQIKVKTTKTFIAGDSLDAVLLSPSTGVYVFYINESFTLVGELIIGINIDDIIVNNAIVAATYWDNSIPNFITSYDERHGYLMDAMTHLYLHRTIGTAYETGFLLSADPTTGTPNDTNCRAFISEGTIWDEDIEMNITYNTTPTLPFEQDLGTDLLSTGAGIFPIWYKLGNPGIWKIYDPTADRFMFAHNGTTTPPYYNQNNAGTWQLTAVTNLNNVCYYLFVTNSQTQPIICIMGQTIYTNDTTGQNSSVSDLDISDLPQAEFKLLYKLNIKHNTTWTGSTHRARISTITDYRSESVNNIISGTTVSNHVALSNLTFDTSGHSGFQRLTTTLARDPTVDDDESDTGGIGYFISVGDLWINTSSGETFICRDSTTGASIWKHIYSTSDKSLLRVGLYDEYTSLSAAMTFASTGLDGPYTIEIMKGTINQSSVIALNSNVSVIKGQNTKESIIFYDLASIDAYVISDTLGVAHSILIQDLSFVSGGTDNYNCLYFGSTTATSIKVLNCNFTDFNLGITRNDTSGTTPLTIENCQFNGLTLNAILISALTLAGPTYINNCQFNSDTVSINATTTGISLLKKINISDCVFVGDSTCISSIGTSITNIFNSNMNGTTILNLDGLSQTVVTQSYFNNSTTYDLIQSSSAEINIQNCILSGYPTKYSLNDPSSIIIGSSYDSVNLNTVDFDGASLLTITGSSIDHNGTTTDLDISTKEGINLTFNSDNTGTGEKLSILNYITEIANFDQNSVFNSIGKIITIESTDTTGVGTGSIQTAGGLYVAKKIYSDDTITSDQNITPIVSNNESLNLTFNSDNTGTGEKLSILNYITEIANFDQNSVFNSIGKIITIESTDTTGVGTGSIQTAGGLYVAKKIYSDDTITSDQNITPIVSNNESLNLTFNSDNTGTGEKLSILNYITEIANFDQNSVFNSIGKIITTESTETTGTGTGSIQTGGGIFAAKTIWTDTGFHIGPTSVNLDSTGVQITTGNNYTTTTSKSYIVEIDQDNDVASVFQVKDKDGANILTLNRTGDLTVAGSIGGAGTIATDVSNSGTATIKCNNDGVGGSDKIEIYNDTTLLSDISQTEETLYNLDMKIQKISDTTPPKFIFQRANVGPATLIDDDILGSITGKGYDGDTYEEGVKIDFISDETWSDTARGSHTEIYAVQPTTIIQTKIASFNFNYIYLYKLLIVNGIKFDGNPSSVSQSFIIESYNGTNILEVNNQDLITLKNSYSTEGINLNFNHKSGVGATTTDQIIGKISFSGYNGSSYNNSSNIQTLATENWSGTNNGAKQEFYVTNIGSNIPTKILELKYNDITIDSNLETKQINVIETASSTDTIEILTGTLDTPESFTVGKKIGEEITVGAFTNYYFDKFNIYVDSYSDTVNVRIRIYENTTPTGKIIFIGNETINNDGLNVFDLKPIKLTSATYIIEFENISASNVCNINVFTSSTSDTLFINGSKGGGSPNRSLKYSLTSLSLTDPATISFGSTVNYKLKQSSDGVNSNINQLSILGNNFPMIEFNSTTLNNFISLGNISNIITNGLANVNINSTSVHFPATIKLLINSYIDGTTLKQNLANSTNYSNVISNSLGSLYFYLNSGSGTAGETLTSNIRFSRIPAINITSTSSSFVGLNTYRDGTTLKSESNTVSSSIDFQIDGSIQLWNETTGVLGTAQTRNFRFSPSGQLFVYNMATSSSGTGKNPIYIDSTTKQCFEFTSALKYKRITNHNPTFNVDYIDNIIFKEYDDIMTIPIENTLGIIADELMELESKACSYKYLTELAMNGEYGIDYEVQGLNDHYLMFSAIKKEQLLQKSINSLNLSTGLTTLYYSEFTSEEIMNGTLTNPFKTFDDNFYFDAETIILLGGNFILPKELSVKNKYIIKNIGKSSVSGISIISGNTIIEFNGIIFSSVNLSSENNESIIKFINCSFENSILNLEAKKILINESEIKNSSINIYGITKYIIDNIITLDDNNIFNVNPLLGSLSTF